MMNEYISSIDTNKRAFLKVCQVIQKSDNVETVKEIIIETLKNSQFDYNVLTAIYTVSLNQLVNIQINYIAHFIDDAEESVEDFALKIKKVGEDILNIGKEILDSSALYYEFGDYLGELQQGIIGSLVYNETIESKKSYDMFEKEENVCDFMCAIAKKSFTREHRIEIPYMYVFLLSFNNYCNKILGIFTIKNCEINSKKYIERLGNVLTDIIISDKAIKDGTDLWGSSKEGLKKHKKEDKHCIAVNFENLLPNLKYVDDISVGKNADRKRLLAKIPLVSYINKKLTWKTSFSLLELLKKNVELERTNKMLEKAVNLKNSIVQDFSHTYGNMKATSLYDIAQTLMNSENIVSKKMGRKLLIEYGIKQSLTKEVYLMRIKFEEDVTKLHNILLNSISSQKSDKSEGVVDIIDVALQTCLLRIFYDASDREAELIREQLRKPGFSLNAIREEYENQVIFSKKNVLEWISCKLFSIQLSIKDEWYKLSLFKESYASILLRDLFSELLFNVFKYADKNQDIRIELSVERSKKDYLAIQVQNVPLRKIISHSGVGLKSKKDIVKLVNQSNNYDDESNECMFINNTEEQFHIKVLLDKAKFLREGE